MTDTYRIKIDGIKEGSVKDQVVYQLVILFKRSQHDVLRIIDHKGTVVKRGLDLQTAIKYKFTVEQCGCICSIEGEQESAAANANSPDDFTAYSDSAAADGSTAVKSEEAVPPAPRPAGTVSKVADKKDKAEKAGSTVGNEIGKTVNGDPFVVYTPHTFCCNCGGQGEVASIETHFFKNLVFSTRYENDRAITLALPYCPACAETVGQYPVSSVWKWLLAFLVWGAGVFLFISQIDPLHASPLLRIAALIVPLIPSVLLFRWMGRPKPPKTSAYTPVKISQFGRNPNSTRYEGVHMLVISALAAGLQMILAQFSKQDPDIIKRISMKFSNPAYAKDFRKKNKEFVQNGWIKVR